MRLEIEKLNDYVLYQDLICTIKECGVIEEILSPLTKGHVRGENEKTPSKSVSFFTSFTLDESKLVGSILDTRWL